MTGCLQVVVLSNTTIGMLLATINSSIILIALDIFRRIHLDPLTPANTNYLLMTTACLLVGWASVLSLDRSEPALARGPFTPPFRHHGMGHALCRGPRLLSNPQALRGR